MGQLSMEDSSPNLIESLERVFTELKEDRKAQMEIDELLSAHNIPRGTLNEIMINTTLLYDFEEIELVAFTMAIYKVMNRNEIHPNTHFNQTDLKKAEKYKRTAEEFQYPFTLNGVIKSSDTEYAVVMSAEQIALLWNHEALTYNFQSQRLSKKRKLRDGTVVERADIKLPSVKKITQLMLEGKYKSNALLFNILVDGNDNIEYDDGELTIHEGTSINIIDGMHRLQGALNALEQDPDFDMNFIVVIRYLPLTEAQDMLSQVNTTNRFDRTLTKYYGSDEIGAQIARDLMSTPELRNRVSIKTTLDRNFNFLTNFAVLSESIQTVFEPKNTKDRYDAVEVLKKFFGYLINSYEREFIREINEVKKESWINHHNTFVGYVVLAKRLSDNYGVDYPVSKITETIDSIDFRKQEGLPYHEVISPQGKVNARTIKRNIKTFFENIKI